MKTMFRRIVAVCLCVLCAFGSICTLASCARPEPIATLDGQEISVNMYQFMLSRIKGSLSRSGYSVNSADFWSTIVDSNNTTYEEFFRQTAVSNARAYLAALALFDELSLKLPQSEYDRIDEDIADSIETAGSKTALNNELSAFGVNADMLRDIYVIEAKVAYVQEHLYGKDGAKVAAQVRQEYLEKNAVAFRYVLIRSFDYVYETDTNGDEIYFLPKENNAKVNNIAYDKTNGTVRLDEFGQTVKDENGEAVYFTSSGRIAYDKEKGVRAPVLDNTGAATIKVLSSEQIAENKAAAEEILASVESGDYTAFEAILAEYALDPEDIYETGAEYDTDMSFLFISGDNGDDTLNDISDALALKKDGELCQVNISSYGYYVAMRYPIPSDAVTNSDYEDQFPDLADRVVNQLFADKCRPYMDKVKVDADLFAELPPMVEVGTNFNY